jgi:peptidoglycan-associated lipoprotein
MVEKRSLSEQVLLQPVGMLQTSGKEILFEPEGEGEILDSSAVSEEVPELQDPETESPSGQVSASHLNQKADLNHDMPLSLTDVFFDYDQVTFREDAITVLEGDAKLLMAKYPNRTLTIQGHCDERGTEEYNIALGSRRAQAVKEYLVDLGVPAKNLETISYGKTRPFCTGQSLKCLRQNRRGHFVWK